jgi:hypothetical protein
MVVAYEDGGADPPFFSERLVEASNALYGRIIGRRVQYFASADYIIKDEQGAGPGKEKRHGD